MSKPPSISCEKSIRIRSRSVSTTASPRKRASVEQRVSLICYPLDCGPREEAACRPAQSKLHSYMRKYQI